mgnify:CR=1 FL=1
MAQSGFDETDPNQPPTKNIPVQQARQCRYLTENRNT